MFELFHCFPADFRGVQENKACGSEMADESCLPNRKERPISLGIFPLPPGDAILTPEAQREAGETPGSEHWKFPELSQPRSHTSLKVRTLQVVDP